MTDEQYYTVNTKDLNFIGSVPHKLTLTIYLSDEKSVESYFGRYENIVLIRNGKEYAFTPEEFINGMNRMAHTAKKVRVPRIDDLQIGHTDAENGHDERVRASDGTT